MTDLKKYIILKSENIFNAFDQISRVGNTLIVVDNNNNYLGTLSNGDLRNAILKNNNFETKITNIFNKNSFFFSDLPSKNSDLKKIFIKHKFDIIPVIKNKKILKIIFWDEVFSQNKKINLKAINYDRFPVVILAGGEGTRLLPFTQILPKPLIPIKDKTVIEHIFSIFNNYGKPKINLLINYKSKILKAFFSEIKISNNLIFIKEKKPLGTAGGLSLFKKKINKKFHSVFVTNCDVLFQIKLDEFVNFHLLNKNDISLIVSPNEHVIPYGNCILDEHNNLKRIDEKPKINLLINTGMYLIKSNVLDMIKFNTYLDMNELINQLRINKYKVGVFPISNDSWKDIGQWNEYKKVVNNFLDNE